VLRTCNGSVFQTFLGPLSRGAPPQAPARFGIDDGTFFGHWLSAVQQKNIYHHNAAAYSMLGNAQVTFTVPDYVTTQLWDFGGVI